MNHKTEIPVLTVDDVCVTFPLRYSLWERLHGYPRRAVQALNGEAIDNYYWVDYVKVDASYFG